MSICPSQYCYKTGGGKERDFHAWLLNDFGLLLWPWRYLWLAFIGIHNNCVSGRCNLSVNLFLIFNTFANLIFNFSAVVFTVEDDDAAAVAVLPPSDALMLLLEHLFGLTMPLHFILGP